MFENRRIGGKIFGCVFLLTLFGLIMIYSSSWIYSQKYYGSSFFLLLKQAVAAAVGLAALIAFARIDYMYLVSWSELLLAGFVLLTALTLLPGLGVDGRWLQVGPVAVQPTEGIKFALVLWVTLTIRRKRDQLGDFVEGVLPFFVVLGIVGLFTLSQPDFSMTMLYGATIFFMLFVAGARLADLAKVVLAGLPLVAGLLLLAPYRFERLISFLHPLRHQMDEGYQLMQSLIAVGSGGIWGRGLGQSAEKFLYLPSAYNDFIFSIVCEELGFVGALLVIGLFSYLAYRGFGLALDVENETGKLLAAGITFVLVFQAALNFCVTLGLLPVTGLTLPFISYGGSSLIVSLAMVGTLINISQT